MKLMLDGGFWMVDFFNPKPAYDCHCEAFFRRSNLDRHASLAIRRQVGSLVAETAMTVFGGFKENCSY